MKAAFLVLALALTGTFADVSHLSGIQTVLHDDGYHYDKPKVPFPPPPSVKKEEDYLPPPQPLCDNGSPDSSYPYCCSNGAKNEFCCTGRYVNPSCSAPPTQPPTTRYIAPTTPRYVPPPPPPPPQPLCDNGAPDSSYPYCCSNGAKNEFCCTGRYVNPECAPPATQPPPPPPPQPLCDNGAPDSTYPHCCANGARNEFCCTGRYVNPTCSPPPTQPPTTRYIAPTTPRYVPPPPLPPPQPLCDNGAPDSSYPYCCSNGAKNEFCCTGRYVNPECAPPATQPPPPPPPQPLCDNGSPDSSYPYCCSNGAKNEFCCIGRYVNPTCSAPPTQPPTTRYIAPTTPRYVPPPPPPKPLCDNGSPDSSYPYCCSNGAKNEYCCIGRYVNPTCSAPATTQAPIYLPPETTTRRFIPPPPPPKYEPLCANRAPDSSYPFCCANGAKNEFCCTGRYVNAECAPPSTQPPTTRYIAPTTPRYVPPPPPPPPQPLCDNGAPDSSYPYCCSNGARNEFCCTGRYVNAECAPPATQPPPPPPPQPLCDNGSPDSSYPYCCSNGAKNEFCCIGRYVNPTCSAPPTQPPTTRYIAPTTPRYVPPPPPPKVEVNDNYLPPCGNGGTGPNCDTASGYNYGRPSIAFRY